MPGVSAPMVSMSSAAAASALQKLQPWPPAVTHVPGATLGPESAREPGPESAREPGIVGDVCASGTHHRLGHLQLQARAPQELQSLPTQSGEGATQEADEADEAGEEEDLLATCLALCVGGD